jgi:uncharacterized Tic20 family protein
VQTEQQNYGVAEGSVTENPMTGMETRDERTWSVLSHLSIFLNLVTGFLGPVASLIIWLVYRDRSQKAAFQALQSTIYQGAWIVILAVGWAIIGLLTFILIGFLLSISKLTLNLHGSQQAQTIKHGLLQLRHRVIETARH